MSDYTEHLISMAGGDGETIESLIETVRAQQATIDRVLNLANTRGRCGWSISSDELRRVLRGES